MVGIRFRFVLGWPSFRVRTVSLRECKSGSPKIYSLEDGVPFQLGDTYLKHPLVFGAASDKQAVEVLLLV